MTLTPEQLDAVRRETVEACCKALSTYCAGVNCGLRDDKEGRMFLINALAAIRAAFPETQDAKPDARQRFDKAAVELAMMFEGDPNADTILKLARELGITEASDAP